MNEAFLKALKWYFLVFFVVVGASCFIISNHTGSNNPILVGVLAFGVVYVLTTSWQDANGKVFMISAVLFLIISQISLYVPPYLYMYTGIDVRGFNPYIFWGALEGIVGIPVMTYVFKKYD